MGLYRKEDKVRNSKNQINYTIGRVKRYLNNPQESRYSEIMDDIFDCGLEQEICTECICEDFGYCGLRDESISDYVIRTKYCFTAFLKYCDKSK